MKSSRCSSLLALALWHVSCHGARVGAPRQDGSFSTEVAPNEGKMQNVTDKFESYAEGDAFTNMHREMKECGQNQRVFFVTFTTDNRAEETSFQLLGPSGGIIGRAPESGRRFQDNTQYTFRYCVWKGYQHKLRWKDTEGNGMCCQFGKGTYRYGIDGTTMYESNMQKTFFSIGVHTFKVPSGSLSQSIPLDAGKSDNDGVERDNAWLEAHNVRRKKYHVQWGKSYVPLKWSPMLADQAKQWANQLAKKCDGVPISQISKVKLTVADHEPNIPYGENMAANFGNGAYGELKTPDQVLNRMVEWELDVGYPHNYHMTQVLWRASKYVGCADSVQAIEGVEGGYCRFQVCRYAVTGNCAMGLNRYADGSVNWKASVLNDDLRQCGTSCTPEGWC